MTETSYPPEIVETNLSVRGFTCGLFVFLSLMYFLLQTAPVYALVLTTDEYYTDEQRLNLFRSNNSITAGDIYTLYHRSASVPAAHEFRYQIFVDTYTSARARASASDGSFTFTTPEAFVVNRYELEWNYGSNNVDITGEQVLFFRFITSGQSDITLSFYDDDGTEYNSSRMTKAAGANTIAFPINDLVSAENFDPERIRRIKATFAVIPADRPGFDLKLLDSHSRPGGQFLVTGTPEPGLPALAGAALLLMQAARRRRQRAKNTHI